MRSLEKGKNKGNKETRETKETKGMRVREIEYGRKPEKKRTTLETFLHRLQGYYFHNQQHPS